MSYKPIKAVVALIVPVTYAPQRVGIILVRRIATDETHDALVLPGGYQNSGESWQAAGARELFEETGIVVRPETIRLQSVHTIEDNTMNLIIAATSPYEGPYDLKPDGIEVSEVTMTDRAVETIWPEHTRAISRFFAGVPK